MAHRKRNPLLVLSHKRKEKIQLSRISRTFRVSRRVSYWALILCKIMVLRAWVPRRTLVALASLEFLFCPTRQTEPLMAVLMGRIWAIPNSRMLRRTLSLLLLTACASLMVPLRPLLNEAKLVPLKLAMMVTLVRRILIKLSSLLTFKSIRRRRTKVAQRMDRACIIGWFTPWKGTRRLHRMEYGKG